MLATDFGKHFDILGQFKSKIASGGLDFEKAEDRRLVLQLSLKCADISHTTKSLETHRKWTEAITEEFYSQGDKEREKVRAKGKRIGRLESHLLISLLRISLFLLTWIGQVETCRNRSLVLLGFWRSRCMKLGAEHLKDRLQRSKELCEIWRIGRNCQKKTVNLQQHQQQQRRRRLQRSNKERKRESKKGNEAHASKSTVS